jgi:hypothetical protein
MPLQGFQDGQAPTIKAAWLNLIDAFYVTLFNSATTAAAARTAIGVDATGINLPLAGGNMTGPMNEAATTFASNTATPDIWTAQGNVINYTNSTTVTGFAAAPQVGCRRRLIPGASVTFTTSANLQIIGLPSGKTITIPAGAIIDVLATLTTVFQMTYSFSGNYTATTVGMAVEASMTVQYYSSNGFVQLTGSYGTLTGTSNATTFTVTGMPAVIRPLVAKLFSPLLVEDNTVFLYTGYGILGTNGTLTLTPTATTSWTASGTKALMNVEFSYGL